MKKIYIFDIDGCIMPPIFTNFNNSETRANLIKEVVKIGNNIKLFPSFIEFYKKHCTQVEYVYFITGRKLSEFGKLTAYQLKALNDIKKFQVVYYPERKAHRINKYFTWKVKKIKKIIKDCIKRDENFKGDVNFNIFDDMNNYFLKIRRMEDKWKIQINTILIDSENIWNHII